jgi:hypothetical protein
MLTSELTVTRFTNDLPQGDAMSVRNAFVLFVALSSLIFLAACGGGNGSAPVNPTPPPSGSFGNSNLNGTYVFSVAGTDDSGAPYAMAGTMTANGSGSGCSTKGSITGGTFDIADTDTTEFTTGPLADVSMTGSYCIGTDGRGQATITTNIGGGFPQLTFDFVMQDNSHGLITEFDTFGTSSGTLDLQSSGVTPSGPYAFLFSGTTYTGAVFASAGNFTVSSGAISAGTADFNNGAASVYTDETLTGTLAVSSTAPSTSFSTSTFPSMIFDVFPIDSTHLKFIEMDTTAVQTGDAFSQSTTTMPTGTLAFTLNGELTAEPFTAGGFFVTDGAGNITSSSSEDYNKGGTLSPTSSPSFTGTYAATTGNAGRYTLTGFTGFTGGTTYVAYPTSGGVLLLEVDTSGDIAGITTGAAYTQTSGATFAASEGYALNLSGDFLGTPTEVDDIAEFTADSSGATVTGIIDENSAADGPATYGAALSGTYSGPSGGRGQIIATAGTSSSNTTLNGGFSLLFYTVDGTTFPFMEYDSGQVATGVFVEQNPTGSSSAVASHAMYVPHPLILPHGAKRKKQ